MITSKSIRVLAGVAGGAVALTMFAAPSAIAATTSTFKVTGGPAISIKNSGNLIFKDVIGGSVLTCTSLSVPSTKAKAIDGTHAFAPATVPASTTSLSPASTWAVQASTLTGCTNVIVGKVTVTTTGTWSQAVSSTTATGTVGYLYGVSAKLVATGCSFTATGAVYGTYTNATGTLAGSTTPGLVLSGVTGPLCAAVKVANGHKAYLSGKILLSPAIKIS